jgi:hypothetical protein
MAISQVAHAPGRGAGTPMETLFWLLLTIPLLLFTALLVNLVSGVAARRRPPLPASGQSGIDDTPSAPQKPLLDRHWQELCRQLEETLPAGYRLQAAVCWSRIDPRSAIDSPHKPNHRPLIAELVVCDHLFTPVVAILRQPPAHEQSLSLPVIVVGGERLDELPARVNAIIDREQPGD